ncbi:hypothetical protein ADUPG1_012585 [Aduncisulcus paluster]|uniref:Uncharacterized protein n=1 Tax=Aduncisulcus paluster TaxID=2918883 RepID=A0ABQ5JZX7_9EUKA|nr:hypothetical protein ADUPG1_012585 [Aduncisulcus paluster]
MCSWEIDGTAGIMTSVVDFKTLIGLEAILEDLNFYDNSILALEVSGQMGLKFWDVKVELTFTPNTTCDVLPQTIALNGTIHIPFTFDASSYVGYGDDAVHIDSTGPQLADDINYDDFSIETSGDVLPLSLVFLFDDNFLVNVFMTHLTQILDKIISYITIPKVGEDVIQSMNTRSSVDDSLTDIFSVYWGTAASVDKPQFTAPRPYPSNPHSSASQAPTAKPRVFTSSSSSGVQQRDLFKVHGREFKSVFICDEDAGVLSLWNTAQHAHGTLEEMIGLNALDQETYPMEEISLDGYNLAGSDANAEYDRSVVKILSKPSLITWTDDEGKEHVLDSGLTSLSVSGCSLSSIDDILTKKNMRAFADDPWKEHNRTTEESGLPN